MRTSQKVLLGAAGVVVGGVALAATVLTLAWGGMCGNDVVARVPSPDGRLEAVVFQRDCGATTDFSTQVSVVRAGGSLPDAGGNLLVATGGPPGPGGGPVVRAEWAGATRLRLRYYPGTHVVRAAREALGVRAEYEPLPTRGS